MSEEILSLMWKEFLKILFQLVYWGILAIGVIASFKYNLISSNTAVPDSIEHYVNERLNLWVYLFEAFILVMIAGVAAISKSEFFVSLVREELGRICYTIATFMGWSSIVIAYIKNDNGLYGTALGIFLGFGLIGMFFTVWMEGNKSQSVQQNTK